MFTGVYLKWSEKQKTIYLFTYLLCIILHQWNLKTSLRGNVRLRTTGRRKRTGSVAAGLTSGEGDTLFTVSPLFLLNLVPYAHIIFKRRNKNSVLYLKTYKLSRKPVSNQASPRQAHSQPSLGPSSTCAPLSHFRSRVRAAPSAQKTLTHTLLMLAQSSPHPCVQLRRPARSPSHLDIVPVFVE